LFFSFFVSVSPYFSFCDATFFILCLPLYVSFSLPQMS
jgi:hypothetical protein